MSKPITAENLHKIPDTREMQIFLDFFFSLQIVSNKSFVHMIIIEILSTAINRSI